MLRCLFPHHREMVPKIENSGVESLKALCSRLHSRKKTQEQRSINDGTHSYRSRDSERLRKVSWQGSLRHMRAGYTNSLVSSPSKGISRLAMMVPIFGLWAFDYGPDLDPVSSPEP
jgi:hypothetical protein